MPEERSHTQTSPNLGPPAAGKEEDRVMTEPATLERCQRDYRDAARARARRGE